MDYSTKSETDIAYQILEEAGKGIYYKDLILEVIDKKRKPVQSLARAISEVYTSINMDSRFHHMGQSVWGLTEWNPQEVKRSSASSASAAPSRSGSHRREKLLEGIQEEDMDDMMKDEDDE